MSKRHRLAFWAESGMACTAGFLSLLTAVWPDWIERVTGLQPDAYSGSVEWALAVGFLLAAALLGTLARREWRRAAAASSP